MSGSAARRVPAGLDTMNAEDTAAMQAMQDADAAPAPTPDDIAPPEAPAAEEAPEREDTAEDTTETKPPPRRDAKVPHAALHEERVKRQNTEAKLRETETRHAAELARTQERLTLLAATVAEATKPAPPAAPAPEAIPDFDADPAGYIKGSNAAHQREIAELRAMLSQQGQSFQQQQEQQRQFAAVQDLQRWAQAQEAALAATDPTYADAQKHILTLRDAELQAMGLTDPAVRQQAILQDVFQMAKLARDQGANFAERVRDLAKVRGWAPKAAATPAAEIDPATVELPRAAAQERGREMAVSLGSAGGAPRGPLSVEAILAMSDDDFSNTLAKAKKGGIGSMRALFGS